MSSLRFDLFDFLKRSLWSRFFCFSKFKSVSSRAIFFASAHSTKWFWNLNPSTCAMFSWRNKSNKGLNPCKWVSDEYIFSSTVFLYFLSNRDSNASNTKSSARFGSRSNVPINDWIARVVIVAAVVSSCSWYINPSVEWTYACNAAINLLYPSLSSRKRLNFFCWYTTRVLTLISFFRNVTALTTNPTSSRNSPSQHSNKVCLVTRLCLSSSSSFVSSTSLFFNSSSFSTSSDTNQMTSVR